MNSTTLNVQDTTLQLVAPGTSVGGGEAVPEGKLGILLRTLHDEVLVIGTASQLRAAVFSGMTAPIPADVPLFDDDDTSPTIVGVVVAEPPAPDNQ